MAKQEQKYRIGRHHRRKARKYLWLSLLGVLLMSIGFIVFFVVRALDPSEADITMPEPITREYAPAQESLKEFDANEFTIRLPQDWRLKDHQTGETQNLYIFQSTLKNQDNRWLEISVDKPPQQRAFNRMLPVNVENNRIIAVSSVSDNCTTYTGTAGVVGTPDAARGEAQQVPSKWQGVSFLCDMANYTRNVVGVGSAANGHALPLTGSQAGRHIFHVIYIDHNINPDYQILERALESLTVK